MNNHQFDIYLAEQQLNQKSLAALLGITPNSLSNYRKSGFPGWFDLAIEGLTVRRAAESVVNDRQLLCDYLCDHCSLSALTALLGTGDHYTVYNQHCELLNITISFNDWLCVLQDAISLLTIKEGL